VLLDIGSVLGGFALAVVAFVVVILVCVIVLRLLAVILPPYQGPYQEAAKPDEAAAGEMTDSADPPTKGEPRDAIGPSGEAPVPDTAADREG
jgi:hypothetical protein